MALQSMTGFARTEGSCGRHRWAWELRSVNDKGLDLRLRLPPGMEALEVALRDIASKSLARGNIQAGHLYSVMTYMWMFAMSLDDGPQLLEKYSQLKDIGRRVNTGHI